jgi:hypothetical protein
LSGFVAARQQDYELNSVDTEINRVFASKGEAKLHHTFAYGLRVSKIACLDPGNSGTYSSDRSLISQRIEPFLEGPLAVLSLVNGNEFGRRSDG